jgi:hypothetical protein
MSELFVGGPVDGKRYPGKAGEDLPLFTTVEIEGIFYVYQWDRGAKIYRFLKGLPRAEVEALGRAS